jgi:hypothetical protein
MNNIIQKQLFRLQYAKMPIKCVLERELPYFIDSELYVVGDHATLDIELNRQRENKFLNFDKKHLTQLCRNIFNKYCPSINLVVNFNINSKTYYDHPKFYFNQLLQKVRQVKRNSSPLNALTSLESLKLHKSVQGVIIRVKGKRGVRKTRKTLFLGKPCFHSCQKDILSKRRYSIESKLGTTGVKIYVKRDPLYLQNKDQ